MATTYQAIATVEVGAGGAANIEFTSIPTYTDLLIKASIRTTNSSTVDTVGISFNGNASNYSWRRLRGDGTSAASGSASAENDVETGYATGNTATANTFGNLEFYIPNYGSSNYKSFSSDGVSENNATQAFAGIWASLWSDTSAITSVKLIPVTGANFMQYTTATLYGIKNS